MPSGAGPRQAELRLSRSGPVPKQAGIEADHGPDSTSLFTLLQRLPCFLPPDAYIRHNTTASTVDAAAWRSPRASLSALFDLTGASLNNKNRLFTLVTILPFFLLVSNPAVARSRRSVNSPGRQLDWPGRGVGSGRSRCLWWLIYNSISLLQLRYRIWNLLSTCLYSLFILVQNQSKFIPFS